MPFAAVTLALALAGPTTPGLPALHSAQAEQAAQDAIFERVRGRDDSRQSVPRPVADPDSLTEKRAAAWRADHLTCASRKGRTGEQYQRECGAWLAEEAARGASR
jgi:hypothetical protein